MSGARSNKVMVQKRYKSIRMLNVLGLKSNRPYVRCIKKARLKKGYG